MSKAKPIPVRFEQDEARALADLADRTGLPVADIIRRCVRLLSQEVQRQGSVGFILDLTSLSAPKKKITYLVAEDPPPFPRKARGRRAAQGK